ncbi:MAG TPA: GNAT family N-acetyltransferase [Gaiellaceae bacterium]|nr:GNAT family N-acetyltransferase [Gaiellaceae bacterium]
MPTNSVLRSFAEDPPAWGEIDPRSGMTRVLTDRYCLLLGSSPATTLVSRLRLDPDEVPEAVHEVREEIARREHREAVWRVGSSATPADLVDRLTAHGFVPADRPGHEPHLTSMVLTEEPPAVRGVEARRIGSAAELKLASAISAVAFGEEEDEEDWDMRFVSEREGHTPRVYLAFVDGTPVGAARALVEDDCPAVMLISGGVLAEARGRGAYRALVRARWDDAVAADQPALVVHAGAMSRPILERLGFQAVAEQEVLLDPTTC